MIPSPGPFAIMLSHNGAILGNKPLMDSLLEDNKNPNHCRFHVEIRLEETRGGRECVQGPIECVLRI